MALVDHTVSKPSVSKPQEAFQARPARRRAAMRELSSKLRFTPETGRIWLEDRRMVLMHISALGALRYQLIESFGMEHARSFLTQMGYVAGWQDGEFVHKLRPEGSLSDKISGGPQLHGLQGVVTAEEVRLEGNLERGEFCGEWIWRDSAEDEMHIEKYGIGDEPVSWTQVGYASGYATAVMGCPILFREIECRAMGHQACRVVGRPAAEWDGVADDLRYFPPDFAPHLLHRVERPEKRPAWLAATPTSETDRRPQFLVGGSAAFNVAFHMMEKVAHTQATVLFSGESGVGKELFARALHRLGSRAANPFVAVNCAAIPEQLVESELFGVERGAYTGATEARAGRFERAHGGTLFLDEVSSLGLSAQGKLLRALQEGEIERVGDRMTRRVDVRIIAASNVSLRDEVSAGRFREDLYFRLNVFPVHIPPLRDRKDDIPLLVDHFLQRFCKKHDKTITGFTQRAIEGLLNYDWPGNIRELENILERGVILTPEGGEVDLCHLFISGEKVETWVLELSREGALGAARGGGPAQADASAQGLGELCTRALDGQASLDEIEGSLLRAAVERSGGNLSAAARLLGMTRGQLAYRLEKHGAGGASE